MVALKAAEVDRFIARPDPAKPIVLVYGPDAGLVCERVEALVAKSVDDTADPFQLARLDGDALARDPARLSEEANTIPLFGGRRAVWVKAGGQNFAPAVETLLAFLPQNTRVVIQAGDLRRNAPLRTICERAKAAVALPCYPDAEAALSRLIDVELRESGLSISAQARAALLPFLGGDRLASRHEIGKLALFARGKERIEVDDVIEVVADASALAIDALVDAALAGEAGELEVQFAKARTAGTAPGTIMSAALRQIFQLHRARLAVEQGMSVTEAANGMQPFLQFSRRAAVQKALSTWTSPRLEQAMARLAQAALETRRQSSIGAVTTDRALLELALHARKRA
jgi:DNA polymerase III subunit delta